VCVRERSSLLVGEISGFEPSAGVEFRGMRVGDLIVFNEAQIFDASPQHKRLTCQSCGDITRATTRGSWISRFRSEADAGFERSTLRGCCSNVRLRTYRRWIRAYAATMLANSPWTAKHSAFRRRNSPQLPIAWREAESAALRANAADTCDDRVSENIFDVEDERAEVDIIVHRMNHGAN
jgi:hypothetical protein